MKYFYTNGEFAGHGVNGCNIAICEGEQVVSFTKEWSTVEKKIDFLTYGVDKQKRLLKHAANALNGISDTDKETFYRVLEMACEKRKATLNAKKVTGEYK